MAGVGGTCTLDVLGFYRVFTGFLRDAVPKSIQTVESSDCCVVLFWDFCFSVGKKKGPKKRELDIDRSQRKQKSESASLLGRFIEGGGGGGGGRFFFF